MNNREALQKAYALLSPYADKQGWEFNNNLVHLRFITRHVPKTSSVLDVGCGIGILALALTLLGYKVAGVDKYLFEEDNSFTVDDTSGLRLIWKTQGLDILPKDILQSGPDIQYGSVISIATIEHQKDCKRFLESLARAALPGGLIYIATPNISHLLNRVRFLFGRSPMQAHLPRLFERGESYEGHWREYTLDELRQMFGWLGLTIVEAQNVQSMRPRFKRASPRSWHVNLFRALARLVPGTRDTNIIIAKKEQNHGV